MGNILFFLEPGTGMNFVLLFVCRESCSGLRQGTRTIGHYGLKQINGFAKYTT